MWRRHADDVSLIDANGKETRESRKRAGGIALNAVCGGSLAANAFFRPMDKAEIHKMRGS
jgi:hypothetical protein